MSRLVRRQIDGMYANAVCCMFYAMMSHSLLTSHSHEENRSTESHPGRIEIAIAHLSVFVLFILVVCVYRGLLVHQLTEYIGLPRKRTSLERLLVVKHPCAQIANTKKRKRKETNNKASMLAKHIRGGGSLSEAHWRAGKMLICE